MEKLKKQKLIDSFNLIIGSIGVFLILLGLFSLLEIYVGYLVLLLATIGLILVVWKFLMEKKLK